MVSINTTVSGTSVNGTTGTQVQSKTQSTGTSTSAAGTSSAKLSAFARLLSDAATRAETRDASLSRSQLRATAESALDEITGTNYANNKARYDAQLPDTDDADLLALAQQSTDYLNGKASNPFKGMSREQLALITYDDSGTFTVNERRAALSESNDQYNEWARKVVDKAVAEYNRTGKITSIYSDMLEFYQSQPAIEQAQYPDGYAVQLQAKITATTSDTQTTSLFDTLNQWNSQNQNSTFTAPMMSLFTLLADSEQNEDNNPLSQPPGALGL
ncbi:hypothetical protein [Musicola keenii]|uniref:hypothetical protein n=1 Tax=Musicola keenii TaxID=2884250 RepID=UPI00177ACE40|nr:hypothetical protein [Musicola keenii]